MSSSDFFCNRCLLPMHNSGPPFSMTQCGHIYCHKCASKVSDHCPACNSTGVQSMVLTEPLPPSIATLFTPLPELYDQLGSLVKFQSEQYAIATESADRLNKKYQSLKNTYWHNRKRTEQEMQELRSLKEKYDNLKAESLFGSHQQASASNAPTVNFSNADNSYRYQMNPNLLQNYTRDLPQQQMSRYHNYRHPNEPRFSYTGYNTTSTSDDSDRSASTLQGSSTDTSLTPENIFRIPNMNKVPRSKKST